MYKVMMLPMAEEDIMNNTDYIAFEKKAPETALELAMGFRNTIAKLEFMPKQHELDEDEELAAREIRKCYYKNCPGNLGFTADELLSRLSLLMPAFSLPCAPPPVARRLHRPWEAPLPILKIKIPPLRCPA